jgi:Flp pilus assembly pilin Flp
MDGTTQHPQSRSSSVGVRRYLAALQTAEDGAQLVEYAFILMLITIVALPAVTRVGQIVETFYTVAQAMF